jgi:glutamyl-tRNA reductase
VTPVTAERGDASVVSGVSVSHVDASVDEIGAAGGDDARTVLEDLLADDRVAEAFALATCNRAEAYVVCESADAGRRALDGFAPEVRDGAVADLGHEESIRHLMRVAAGLESLVVGEDQILGQFRRAVEDARSVGALGPTLEDALTKALRVGERARTETAINEGAVSLGSAAVELAATETAVADATALVLGAGEMGTLAARALATAGAGRVVVANRTVPHATAVAGDVDAPAEGIPLDLAAATVDEADVVIAATASPDRVLDRTAFEGAGETVVVDVAQPRDVDPAAADVPGVVVHDIDSLEAVTDETRRQRRAAAEAVERMIDEEFDRLMETRKRKRADDAIGAMYESAERLKERELEEALSRLEAQGDLTEDQRETVASLADALVGQLLAAPTRSLRDAAAEDDWATIQTAMTLFDPDFEADLDLPDYPDAAPEGVEAPEDLPVDDLPADADVPPGVLEGFADD